MTCYFVILLTMFIDLGGKLVSKEEIDWFDDEGYNPVVNYDSDSVLIKIMLDTNAFDCICDNHLEEQVKQYKNQNDVLFFYTHVQQDEINKMPEGEKKDCIKKVIQSLTITIMTTDVGFVGTDEKTGHGYTGARVDLFKIIGDEDEKLIENMKKENMKNPMQNTADISILFTATQGEFDFLVTNDTGYDKLLEIYNKERNSKLKIVKCDDFKRLLETN